MPDSSRPTLPVRIKPTLNLRTPFIIHPCTGKRDDIILAVRDELGELQFEGTYDEIMEFGAEFMRAAISWALISGHSDWLGEDVTLQDGGAQINVR